MIAWAVARQSGAKFYLRIDDIDPGRNRAVDQQIRELEWLGIDWDGDIIYQSKRRDLYEDALRTLEADGNVFECYCSRKDIREAVRAPHSPMSHYPGTCLENITVKTGKPAALRLRPNVTEWRVLDELSGEVVGPIDAFVLRRGDGWPAYNLASVVDDILLGIDHVVRGDDLLEATPGQEYLAHLLGARPIKYVHVPLVLGEGGARLAKRDGAVTIEDMNLSQDRVLEVLTGSMGIKKCGDMESFLNEFRIENLPRHAVRFGTFEGKPELRM
jgi:Glutamyl- and glutaminyl-tRNA synthetases